MKRIRAVAAYVLCALFIITAARLPFSKDAPPDMTNQIASIYTATQPTRKVYIGGYPVGLVLNCDGVIVEGNGSVNTGVGLVKGGEGLKKGDIITHINDERVLNAADISQKLGKAKQGTGEIKVGIKRGSKKLSVNLTPITDKATGEYKLGIWVKDRVTGLGTMTYVTLDGRFGALGHPVVDSETGIIFPCFSGFVYNAKIIGAKKGVAGEAGELKGVFSTSEEPIGTIQKNNKYGVFGMSALLPNAELYDVMPRTEVRVGNAKIYSTVSDTPKLYDIEIIKVAKQNEANDKGLVIRVTDKELLNITGGIVQGMSGSPIIQNGKLVGAVTHVFVNDPTRGYGLFADFMLEN